MTKKTTLPKKPSALIRVALDDLSAVEKLKKDYRINMGFYHQPSIDETKCSVCFAGAVMAQTLGVDKTRYIEPDAFPAETRQKLYALDNFRAGGIAEGLDEMGLMKPMWLADNIDITPYSTNKNKFKKEMAKLADVLEGHGL